MIDFPDECDGRDYLESEIPADLQDEAQLRRHEMLEVAAENDEAVLDLFIEDKEVPLEMVMDAACVVCRAAVCFFGPRRATHKQA